MNNGVVVSTWEVFKNFATDNSLTMYGMDYGEKIDVGIYLGGVRHYYVIMKVDTEEYNEYLAIIGA